MREWSIGATASSTASRTSAPPKMWREPSSAKPREREPLVWDDGRRLTYLAMLVMVAFAIILAE